MWHYYLWVFLIPLRDAPQFIFHRVNISQKIIIDVQKIIFSTAFLYSIGKGFWRVLLVICSDTWYFKVKMNITQKLKETALAIGPVILIVIVLHLTASPLPLSVAVSFAIGAVLVIAGLGVFLAGVDLAIVPSGSLIGASLTRTRNLPVILTVVMVSGFIITLAEPNLKVQGELVQSVTYIIRSKSLILAVSLALGVFLALGMARILLQIPYKLIIVCAYGVVLLLAIKIPPMFAAIAFDSSGAATGPLTVPFFMALGLGVSSVRGGKNSDDDSFGTTGIAAIGAILAVAVLGFILPGDPSALSSPSGLSGAVSSSASVSFMAESLKSLVRELAVQVKNVSLALVPLVVLILGFQKFLLRMPPVQLRRIISGLVYAWIGLILFFTGANTGFIPTGTALGIALGEPELQWLLIPLGCVLGALIVCAEPAMWVLTRQVEEVTAGNIKKPVILVTVAVGVAAGVGLSMWRVIDGFSVWYLLAPAFLLAMALTFITPKLFASIAFDSGSVATGPVSSTLILPITLGAALSSGGNPAVDGFGLIAMIAVTPPISMQILGIMFHVKELKAHRRSQSEAECSAEKGGET